MAYDERRHRHGGHWSLYGVLGRQIIPKNRLDAMRVARSKAKRSTTALSRPSQAPRSAKGIRLGLDQV
jgi:hypothetical protein